MNMKPRRNYVLIEPKKEETHEKTEGGVFIPLVAQKVNPYATGKIIAVGPGYRRDDGSYNALDLKVGDTVLFPRNASTWVDTDTIKNCILLEETAVLATF